MPEIAEFSGVVGTADARNGHRHDMLSILQDEEVSRSSGISQDAPDEETSLSSGIDVEMGGDAPGPASTPVTVGESMPDSSMEMLFGDALSGERSGIRISPDEGVQSGMEHVGIGADGSVVGSEVVSAGDVREEVGSPSDEAAAVSAGDSGHAAANPASGQQPSAGNSDGEAAVWQDPISAAGGETGLGRNEATSEAHASAAVSGPMPVGGGDERVRPAANTAGRTEMVPTRQSSSNPDNSTEPIPVSMVGSGRPEGGRVSSALREMKPAKLVSSVDSHAVPVGQGVDPGKPAVSAPGGAETAPGRSASSAPGRHAASRSKSVAGHSAQPAAVREAAFFSRAEAAAPAERAVGPRMESTARQHKADGRATGPDVQIGQIDVMIQAGQTGKPVRTADHSQSASAICHYVKAL